MRNQPKNTSLTKRKKKRKPQLGHLVVRLNKYFGVKIPTPVFALTCFRCCGRHGVGAMYTECIK